MITKSTLAPRMSLLPSTEMSAAAILPVLATMPVFVAARRSNSGTINGLTHASNVNQTIGGFVVGGVEVAAYVPAATANLDYAWDITADAPKFQAKACIKRPQSFSGPPD